LSSPEAVVVAITLVAAVARVVFAPERDLVLLLEQIILLP
jgi:hypothetical protein